MACVYYINMLLYQTESVDGGEGVIFIDIYSLLSSLPQFITILRSLSTHAEGVGDSLRWETAYQIHTFAGLAVLDVPSGNHSNR